MTATDRAVEEIIRDWPVESRDAARRLVDYYGEPDDCSAASIVWYEKAKPWKRTVVWRAIAQHDFPGPHADCVEQVIDYRVPIDKVDDVVAYDGSVTVRRTRGEMSAECAGTTMNFLAINLAVDIIEGRQSVEEARQAYVDAARKFERGESDPYLEGFRFDLPQGGTRDPDQPAV